MGSGGQMLALSSQTVRSGTCNRGLQSYGHMGDHKNQQWSSRYREYAIVHALTTAYLATPLYRECLIPFMQYEYLPM